MLRQTVLKTKTRMQFMKVEMRISIRYFLYLLNYDVNGHHGMTF